MCDCATTEDNFTEFDTYIFWVRVCVGCGKVVKDWTTPKEPDKKEESSEQH